MTLIIQDIVKICINKIHKMVEVFIERENKTKQVKENNLKAVLDNLKINPETVLIVKNDELVTINTKINPKDKIKLLSVVSGG